MWNASFCYWSSWLPDIHQVDAKPQLLLVPNTDHQINGGGQPTKFSQARSDSSSCESKRNLHPHGHYEYCDILMTPRLVEDDGRPNGNISDIGKGVTLTETQQAVILVQCLHLKRRSQDDELSRSEMAPYIEAIDAQHQSYCIVRCFCDILRIRWESTRSHTKQRALLMMDKLAVNLSDTEEFRDLQAYLDEIRKRLNATSSEDA